MRHRAELKDRDLASKIDPAATALVIIDMQNDFAVPDGACEQSGDDLSTIEPMIHRLKGLIAVAREKEILIVHVRMNNDQPYVAANLAEAFVRRGLGPGPCRSGTVGEQFVPGMEPVLSDHEFLVTKHRFSGFWGTEIDLILRSNGIKTLVLAGIATEVCVESTARDGFFRDYSIVIAGDCTASFSVERHKASHALFERSFGMVEPASHISEIWRHSNQTRRGWRRPEKDKAVLKTLEERLLPAHTALLLIGLQQDVARATRFADRKSTTSQNALWLLDEGRRAGVFIIHVRSDHSEKGSNVGSTVESGGAAQGERTLSSLEFAPDVAIDRPAPPAGSFITGFEACDGEPIVSKHRFSAFQDTDLELLLRANEIRTVVAIGQAADRCVDLTAREAAMRDFYVIVPEDAVDTEPENQMRQTAALETLGAYFALVPPSQRILAAWVDAGRRGKA